MDNLISDMMGVDERLGDLRVVGQRTAEDTRTERVWVEKV